MVASDRALVRLQWPVPHPFGQASRRSPKAHHRNSRTSIGRSAFMDLERLAFSFVRA